MSNVELIESQVRVLNADDLRAFRDWFSQFDAEAWDRQIEADSKSDAVKPVVDRALSEHEAGRSTIWSESSTCV